MQRRNQQFWRRKKCSANSIPCNFARSSGVGMYPFRLKWYRIKCQWPLTMRFGLRLQCENAYVNAAIEKHSIFWRYEQRQRPLSENMSKTCVREMCAKVGNVIFRVTTDQTRAQTGFWWSIHRLRTHSRHIRQFRQRSRNVTFYIFYLQNRGLCWLFLGCRRAMFSFSFFLISVCPFLVHSFLRSVSLFKFLHCTVVGSVGGFDRSVADSRHQHTCKLRFRREARMRSWFWSHRIAIINYAHKQLHGETVAGVTEIPKKKFRPKRRSRWPATTAHRPTKKTHTPSNLRILSVINAVANNLPVYGIYIYIACARAA